MSAAEVAVALRQLWRERDGVPEEDLPDLDQVAARPYRFDADALSLEPAAPVVMPVGDYIVEVAADGSETFIVPDDYDHDADDAAFVARTPAEQQARREAVMAQVREVRRAAQSRRADWLRQGVAARAPVRACAPRRMGRFTPRAREHRATRRRTARGSPARLADDPDLAEPSRRRAA
jgi:hypothetical protein